MVDTMNFDITPDNDEEEFAVDFGEVQRVGGGGGTSDFNQLTNRPEYNGQKMTGDTNIPEVPAKTSDLTNDGADGTSTYVEANDLAKVAATGEYGDLSNTPTIPIVNDATLTITQNGTSKGTFTANDSDDTTIELSDTTYSDFVGTDGQTAGTAGLVPAPATTDAGKFLKADGTWDTAGGNIIELTSADYDYPTNNPSSIALWNLDTGIYQMAPNTVLKPNDTDSTINASSPVLIILNNDGPNTWGNAIIYYYGATINEHNGRIVVTGPDGLKTKNATIDTPTVVQTTGTSQTDVMSQNATSSMVFNDPAAQANIKIGDRAFVTNQNGCVTIGERASGGRDAVTIGSQATGGVSGGVCIGHLAAGTSNSVAIGYSASSGNRSEGVAIGHSATTGAMHPGSVALGAYAACTRTGEVNIGSTDTSYGYDSTSYRVLGGVHDPVDAHDAATKGYVDSQAGGPTVVQTTGTSTTDVMSQNATSSMVFADPATQRRIKIGANTFTPVGDDAIEIGKESKAKGASTIAIGSNAIVDSFVDHGVAIGTNTTVFGSNAIAVGYSAGTNSEKAVALGRSAQANHSFAVALGAGATTSVAGEINVGTGSTYPTKGYNGTNYRLISGVHDGQNAHDAVTVNQINNLIDAINTATGSNISHIGA